jgi:hypothetical protein
VHRPPNRRDRRAHYAARRRQDRQEERHECCVKRSAIASGVLPERDLAVPILFFHDLHRVLGEPSCPKCPECMALKRDGRIDHVRPDKAAVYAKWAEVISGHRESEQAGPVDHE